jgi:hypothetical protein
MKKSLIAALAAFCAMTANAQVYTGETYGDQQFGAWKGHLVKRGDDSRFRASAVSSNGNWSLNIDVLPPDCNVMISTSLWVGDTTVQADIPSHDFMGALRVDQEDVWDVRFNNSAAMGDQMLMYTAYALSNIQAVFAQMESGSVVRLKVELFSGQAPVYVTFPLNGFSPAFRYETKICAAAREQLIPKGKQPKPASPARPSKPDDKFL